MECALLSPEICAQVTGMINLVEVNEKNVANIQVKKIRPASMDGMEVERLPLGVKILVILGQV